MEIRWLIYKYQNVEPVWYIYLYSYFIHKADFGDFVNVN